MGGGEAGAERSPQLPFLKSSALRGMPDFLRGGYTTRDVGCVSLLWQRWPCTRLSFGQALVSHLQRATRVRSDETQLEQLARRAKHGGLAKTDYSDR